MITFFKLLVQYQERKYQLKKDFETYKMELRILYNKIIKIK